MNTLRASHVVAGALALTVPLAFGVQRQARAGDTGKVVAAAVAGAIIYELLDDDGGHRHRVVRERPHRRDGRNRPGNQWWGGGGWGTPVVRTGYRDGYCGNDDFRFSYRDGNRDRGQFRYESPGKSGKLKVKKGRNGTQVQLRYRDHNFR